MKTKDVSTTLVSLYLQMFLYQIIGLFIFIIARIMHLYNFSSILPLLENHTDSIPLFLWNSWRFDIQAVTYISLPIIIGILIVSHLKESVVAKFQKIMRWYYAVMLTILSLLTIGEFFYYSNFNCRYNIVFFDFFNEGPIGLLQTMWEEYPILGILLACFIIASLVLIIGKRIDNLVIESKWLKGIWSTVVCSILIAGITFIFLRGSVTTYILQVEAFMVSTSEHINQSVPNCLYLLKKSYSEKINSFKLYSDEYLLKEEGFDTLDEAILASGLPLVSSETDEEKLRKALFKSQIENSHHQDSLQPNVLIVLNESWSQFLLEMDKGEELDLLCSLREHLNEDLLFNNIQSMRNGTIYSLEAVTLAMPYLHFFNSRYRFEQLPSSIASPFKEDGYSTAFITGMDPTWENVEEGLSYQRFDTIIGRQNILHSIDNSTTSAIGVYDEFLYQYIQDYLERENENRPKFVLALTTTNHPPFTYPDDMQLPPLNEKWYSSPDLIGDKDILRKYGFGFQYANQSLGDFMENFKKSSLADNTIVLVTGDHNVRSILNYEVVNHKYMYAVPMYLYLPPSYKINKELESRIEQRYGSHVDILPTIAPLCLNSGTSYLSIGQNLLDTTRNDSLYFSYSEKQVLGQDKSKEDSLLRMMKVRELLMKIYYQQKFKKYDK